MMINKKKLKIAYYTLDHGGCTYYRMTLPLETLVRLEKAEVMELYLPEATQEKIREAKEGDVHVFSRILSGSLVESMRDHCNKNGKLFVVEMDDDVHHVHPFSNHYKDYGVSDQIFSTLPDGTKKQVWEDGVNINLAENRKRLELMDNAISKADLVTCTTQILRQSFLQYNDNVVVLPNCLDLRRWKKLPTKPKDHVLLCWAGGSSHYMDLMLLEDVFPHILNKYPQVKIAIIGQYFKGPFRKCGFAKDRIIGIDWESPEAYPYRFAITDADIGLIPLEESDFNRCKSPIKYLEMGSLEMACVVSNVSPYREVYADDNMMLVDQNNPKAWSRAISMLVEDPVLRAKIGGSARRFVETCFDIDKNAHWWLEAYTEALHGIKRKQGLESDEGSTRFTFTETDRGIGTGGNGDSGTTERGGDSIKLAYQGVSE